MSTTTTPTVGMPATVSFGSDSYPYEVVAVTASGHTITLREMSSQVVKGSAHDGSAEWECVPNPAGRIREATLRRTRHGTYYQLKGHTVRGGGRVHLGRARRYHDPHI